MKRDGDKFDRWIVTSAVLHGLMATLVVFSPSLFPMRGDTNWGSNTSGDGGINVRITGSLSGVSLPSPEVVTEDAAANDSTGLYKSEDATPPPPVEDAIPVPDPKAPVKVTPPKPKPRPVVPTKNPAPEPEVPTNAVPFGQGGKPDLAYGQFTTGAGPAGIGFGDGTFGTRY